MNSLGDYGAFSLPLCLKLQVCQGTPLQSELGVQVRMPKSMDINMVQTGSKSRFILYKGITAHPPVLLKFAPC